MVKILVVDDRPDDAETLAIYLREVGHEVTTTENGREALAHVITSMPDVVLLDLAMPEIDGPSFLEVVRSYLRLQSLPVIVLTGLAESPMVDRARTLKVSDVLVKGKASPDDIRRAIEAAAVRVPG